MQSGHGGALLFREIRDDRFGTPHALQTRMSLRRFHRPVVTADLRDPIVAVARKMRDEHVGSVIATREGRPIGIVTDRDLVVRVLAGEKPPSDIRLEDVVTYDPQVLNETDAIETAVRSMQALGVRRLPIVDAKGAVVGIVTADELTALLANQLSMIGAALSDAVDADETR